MDDPLPAPTGVLMCRPDHYRIEEPLNVHARGPGGAPHRIDGGRATAQWEALADAYRQVGQRVEVLDADPELPDQVFVCNTAFPYPDPTGPAFLPARMRHPSREGEVPHAAAWLLAHGHRARLVPGTGAFEAGGDLMFAGDRRVLVGGYGSRSDPDALQGAAAIVDAPLVAVRLVDERYYHLDTCLAPLDAEAALWVPEAFDAAGRAALQELFPCLLEVPDDDRIRMAANAHCPDGRHVLLDEACRDTIRRLEQDGYDPVPVDTSEFRRSGGSVTCLRQVLYD